MGKEIKFSPMIHFKEKDTPEMTEQDIRKSEIEKVVSGLDEGELREIATDYLRVIYLDMDKKIKAINSFTKIPGMASVIFEAKESYDIDKRQLENYGLAQTEFQKENYKKALEGKLED